MLRRAVELEPSSYDLVFALGDFLLRRGRFAEAGEVADRMAAIDPTRPEAAQLRSRASRR
jgi:Flp pilus assembly protein TadD